MNGYPESEPLRMWVVYDHPLDFPDCFVAREWIALSFPIATDNVLTAPTLDALRALIPPAADRWIPRDQFDDPRILGVYL